MMRSTDITAVSNKLKSTGGLTISLHKALKTAHFPLYEKGILPARTEELTTLTMPLFREAEAINLTHQCEAGHDQYE